MGDGDADSRTRHCSRKGHTTRTNDFMCTWRQFARKETGGHSCNNAGNWQLIFVRSSQPLLGGRQEVRRRHRNPGTWTLQSTAPTPPTPSQMLSLLLIFRSKVAQEPRVVVGDNIRITESKAGLRTFLAAFSFAFNATDPAVLEVHPGLSDFPGFCIPGSWDGALSGH